MGVSHDQGWYYPCWGSYCRVFTVNDLYRKYLQPALGLWLLTPLALALMVAVTRSCSLALLLSIGVSLFLGAVISVVAGHIELEYAGSFRFWCQVTVASCILAATSFLPASVLKSLNLPASMVIALLALVTTLQSGSAYYRHRDARASSAGYFHSAELGGYVPGAWKEHIAFATSHKDAPVVEDYWGLWSAATRAHSPYPTDAAIHALGNARGRFAVTLHQNLPPLAVTATFGQLGWFAGWLTSVNWWFYGALLQNYDQEQISPNNVLWRRIAVPRTWPAAECHIENSPEPYISIETPDLGYYEVTLRYSSKFSRGTLLHVRNNLSYAVDAEGYLSIDPRASQWTFPAAILAPGRNRLGFRLTTRSDTLDRLRLLGCTARKIVADAPELLPPVEANPADTPFDLTDGNWINGVSRLFPGFFVSNSPENRARLVPGAQITFYDQRVQRITRQEQNGPYLNIYLDGTYPVHGGAGFPRQFKVQPP
jgi:hypothetical protein